MNHEHSNYFLNDLWKRRADEENGDAGEIKKDKNVLIYQDIKNTIEKNQILSDESRERLDKLVKKIEEASLRYAITINTLTAKRIEKDDKEAIMQADQSRRYAHNSLVDSVNILSRQFDAAGLDNSWRDMIGLDRKQVGTWGQKVADFINQQEKGEINE